MEKRIIDKRSFFQSKMIQAGAGAGKTHGLIETISQIVFKFYDETKCFPRIVVSTFTRKATQEIRERLLKKAIELEKVKDPNGKILIDYLTVSGALHVSTLHGVFSLYLSRFGQAIDLDPRFDFLSPHEIKKIESQTIKKLIEESADLFELLKYYRLDSLVELFHIFNGLNIENGEIAPISKAKLIEDQSIFINKVKHQIRKILMDPPIKAPKGLEENVQVIRSLESHLEEENSIFYVSLISAISGITRMSPGSDKWPSNGVFQEFKESIQELKKNAFLDTNTIERYSEMLSRFHRIGEEFSQRVLKEKLSLKKIDLTDLENLTAYLSEKYPESAVSFSNEWDYWFLDEYQDTSPLQVVILKRLIGESHQYIVGDPQQSIYLFRGARETVFEHQKSEFRDRNAEIDTWVINRRSKPETLYFINYLMSLISSDKFLSMHPWLDASRPIHNPKRVVANIFSLTATQEERRNSEISCTLSHIARLLNEGVPANKIAVLFRTNKDLLDVAIKAKENGLPILVQSSGSFFDKSEVKEAEILLRFLFNPHDNANTFGLLISDWFGVDWNLLSNLRWSTSMWDEVRRSLSTNDQVLQLVQLLDLTRKVGIFSAYETFIQKSRFLLNLRRLDPSGQKEANVWKVLLRLKDLQNKGPDQMLGYFSHAAQDLDGSDEKECIGFREDAAVKLMTIHASKGLEFDHVIIPFLNYSDRSRGISHGFRFDLETKFYAIPFPDEDGNNLHPNFSKNINSLQIDAEKDEKLRVFYVAITRAIESITLIWSANESEEGKEGGIAKILKPVFSESGVINRSEFKFQVSKNFEEVKYVKAGGLQVEKPPFLRQKQVIELKEQRKMSVTKLVDKIYANQPHRSDFEINHTSFVRNLQKASLGTQIHRLFESLKYTSYETVLNEFEKVLNSEQLIKVKEMLINDKVNLIELIKNGFVEWGFNFNHSIFEIEGQVDLWGIDSQGSVVVVDYKTGSSDYSDKALIQLQIYAWALAKCNKIGPNLKIKLVVLYPLEGQVLLKEVNSSAELFSSIEREMS